MTAQQMLNMKKGDRMQDSENGQIMEFVGIKRIGDSDYLDFDTINWQGGPYIPVAYVDEHAECYRLITE